MSFISQILQISDGASTGYLRSPIPYFSLGLSLSKRINSSSITHKEINPLRLLPFTLQLHAIFHSFSQISSKSAPAYQDHVRRTGYTLMGLNVIPWILLKNDTNKVNFLIKVSYLSLTVINLTNIVLTAYTAYESPTTREFAILGATCLGTVASVKHKPVTKIYKTVGLILKFSRCYFAKSKLEMAALVFWAAYDIYDGLYPHKKLRKIKRD